MNKIRGSQSSSCRSFANEAILRGLPLDSSCYSSIFYEFLWALLASSEALRIFSKEFIVNTAENVTTVPWYEVLGVSYVLMTWTFCMIVHVYIFASRNPLSILLCIIRQPVFQSFTIKSHNGNTQIVHIADRWHSTCSPQRQNPVVKNVCSSDLKWLCPAGSLPHDYQASLACSDDFLGHTSWVVASATRQLMMSLCWDGVCSSSDVLLIRVALAMGLGDILIIVLSVSLSLTSDKPQQCRSNWCFGYSHFHRFDSRPGLWLHSRIPQLDHTGRDLGCLQYRHSPSSSRVVTSSLVSRLKLPGLLHSGSYSATLLQYFTIAQQCQNRHQSNGSFRTGGTQWSECQWNGNTCNRSSATTDQGESAITDLVLCKFWNENVSMTQSLWWQMKP